jgi:hypothetical protein
MTGAGAGAGGCTAAGSGIAGRAVDTGGVAGGRVRAAAAVSRALASAVAGFAVLGSLVLGLLATGVTGAAAGSAVAGGAVAGIGAGAGSEGNGDAGDVVGCDGAAVCTGGVEALSVAGERCDRNHGMATATIASTAKIPATAGQSQNQAARLDAGAACATADLAADPRVALTEVRLTLPPWTDPDSTSRRTRRRSACRSAAC